MLHFIFFLTLIWIKAVHGLVPDPGLYFVHVCCRFGSWKGPNNVYEEELEVGRAHGRCGLVELNVIHVVLVLVC